MRKLGLIGNGIQRSSAPRLHQLAGAICGVTVTYDLIDLQDEDPACFEAAVQACAQAGYWGVNVTYPFKERAAKLVTIASAAVQQIGSINTIIFAPQSAPTDPLGQGYNTDYSGFLRAYQQRFPQQPPGVVGVVGTGGVGKPVAFGLAQLGAQALRLYDLDRNKAAVLAAQLQNAMPRLPIQLCTNLAEVTDGVDGLVNCTPVGMVQHPGNPIPADYLQSQQWAFDVIYTPLETAFLAAARQHGLALLSGYELFFYQGVDAFYHFTGLPVDEGWLRAALQ